MAIDERLMKHARGAMIGLAIGDALGMPTQSMSAERIIECYGGPVRRLMDAVPQQPIAPNMKAGSVTDDTEQAFVLPASSKTMAESTTTRTPRTSCAGRRR